MQSPERRKWITFSPYRNCCAG